MKNSLAAILLALSLSPVGALAKTTHGSAIHVTPIPTTAPATPPAMGWSSWNTLALGINEENICANADAQVATGLRDAGYIYCNIDDGYMGARDGYGRVTYNKRLFPRGMRYVADYIRSKGLKPGIYNDAAGHTCGSSMFVKPIYGQGVGFYGHEALDADTYFNRWGYDFIKVDYCGASELELPEDSTYLAIGRAIRAVEDSVGRKLQFNICRWAFPGTWAHEVADSWRISGDISPRWSAYRDIIAMNKYLSAYAGEGHYNDMDMLEIGQGLPQNEDEVHMAMWCIQSSPLLIGCDMTKIPERSLELLKNPELIALNQDALGLQAYIVYQRDSAYVYVKDIEQLNGPTRAVALLNVSEGPRDFDVPLSLIDMEGTVKARDLIAREDMAPIRGRIKATLPPHTVKIFTATGRRIERTAYNAGTAYMPLFNDLGHNPENIAYANCPEAGTAGVKVKFLGNAPENVMEWRNVYSEHGGDYEVSISYASAEPRSLELSVNGSPAATFSDLNTGSFTSFAPVTARVALRPGFNTITLGHPSSWAPDIAGITLRPL